MSNTPILPENFTWVSAYLIVQNVDTAVDFYQKAFGFRLREKMCFDGSSVSSHAEMLYQNQVIMFGREGEYHGKKTALSPLSSKTLCPVSLYIYCEDVDGLYKHALSMGAQSVEGPSNTLWGDRVCRLECQEAYHWSFATYLGVPCQMKKQS